jgi:hypothetical protein
MDKTFRVPNTAIHPKPNSCRHIQHHRKCAPADVLFCHPPISQLRDKTGQNRFDAGPPLATHWGTILWGTTLRFTQPCAIPAFLASLNFLRVFAALRENALGVLAVDWRMTHVATKTEKPSRKPANPAPRANHSPKPPGERTQRNLLRGGLYPSPSRHDNNGPRTPNYGPQTPLSQLPPRTHAAIFLDSPCGPQVISCAGIRTATSPNPFARRGLPLTSRSGSLARSINTNTWSTVT